MTASLFLEVAACGSISPVTGPSAPVPSTSTGIAAPGRSRLLGNWRSVNTSVTFVQRTGSVPRLFTCQGSFSVTSQNGDTFSGVTNLSGNGYNSDRFCSQSGTLSGTVAPDGSISSAVLAPRLGAYQCTFVSGDDVFTGSVEPDGTMQVHMTDVWRCPANLDGGPAVPEQTEFERALTLSFVSS